MVRASIYVTIVTTLRADHLPRTGLGLRISWNVRDLLKNANGNKFFGPKSDDTCPCARKRVVVVAISIMNGYLLVKLQAFLSIRELRTERE